MLDYRPKQETVYKYFGARYYDPNISIWLSVDPLSDKQPHWSPYVYCHNNPVHLVDPDGKLPIVPIVLGVWALVEIGLSAYDAYETGRTITDPEASSSEKLIAGGGFILGLFAPGGGYGTAAKRGFNIADNVLKSGTKFAIDVAGMKVDNIDDFYRATSKLKTGERIAKYKEAAATVAEKNTWTQNKNLSKRFNRTIYSDKSGQHYSLDTQHGRFEVYDKKGQHLGEIDFEGTVKKQADPSGRHNLKIE